MRVFLVSTTTIGFVLASISTSADARAIQLGRHSASEIARICKQVKGTPIRGVGVYGCKKKCSGGTCEVLCVAGLDCVGTTPGARVAADPRKVINTLNNRR